MNKLSIFVNDQPVFEYDRATQLDDNQREFIEKMDKDMDRGFRIHGQLISRPDNRQKARFITMNLLKALQQDDQTRIAVYCAYLADRLSHVVEVHARDQQDGIAIEFVEEH